ncbi:DNA replication complex GINS protein, putative [Babesia caballi]|uniref:DNA replication complex GINS protein, putative n=1 Tax=Babesia caballi TaxID=5871 RepID=A0AAV4LQ54_BABCB|nr:DNA replication complex GINS protein, putative [Babesia caballi]
MFDHDGSQSASFDFFRKRKRADKRPRRDGDVALERASTSRSTSAAESQSYTSRRNTFRGILGEDSRKPPQSQSQSRTQADTQEPTPRESYFLPNPPTVDYELCKAINYVVWARDQMVFGNQEILAHPQLEHEFHRHLEVRRRSARYTNLQNLRRRVEKNRTRVSSTVKIVESVFELMVDVEAAYRFLGSNANPFCRLSQIYINGFTFLRPVSLETFNFAQPDGAAEVTIQRNQIVGNVFAHRRLLSHFSRKCELLPSKFSGDYTHKSLPINNDYVPNLVAKVILQRAKRQLVVVKAIVDVPGIDLSSYEGYVFEDLKTGEKAWLPIYMVERLSHFGFVSVDLPVYLTRSALRELRGREEHSQALEKLPNDYFFEIAYLFTRCHLFERVNVPNLSNRNHIYGYISKVAGIIEDIKYQRVKKIRQAIDSLPMHESIISIDNLQYSETYYVNQYLSAYCDAGDNMSRADAQPNIQIGESSTLLKLERSSLRRRPRERPHRRAQGAAAVTRACGAPL